MWVGFLYTVIDRVVSTSGFTMVSKKWMTLSSLLVSTVNWMARVNSVDVLKEVLFMDFLVGDKGVIDIPVPKPWGLGAVLRTLCSKYSIYKLAPMDLAGEPIAAPLTCSQNWSWKEKYMFLRQNSNTRMMYSTGSTVLSLRVGSFPVDP